MVKKIVGTPMRVFNAQKRTKKEIQDAHKNRGFGENQTQINKDIPRSPLIDFNGTFEDFKSACARDEVYKEQYAQGNFFGGGASEYFLLYCMNNLDLTNPKHMKVMLLKQDLNFAYRDDNGNLCAVGISYSAQKPNSWVMQIVKNTDKPIAKRQITQITHGDLETEKAGSVVVLDNLPEEIRQALNSVKINTLINGIFDIDNEGVVNQDQFESLNKRIIPGQNLDNRDVKKMYLTEAINLAKMYVPISPDIKKQIEAINQQVEAIDFFKGDHSEKIVNDLLLNVIRKFDLLLDSEKTDKIQNKYQIELTLAAMKLEWQADKQSNDVGSEKYKELSSNAVFLREHLKKDQPLEGLLQYQKALEDFRCELDKLDQEEIFNQDVCIRGTNILKEIQLVVEQPTLNQHELAKITEVLKRSKQAITEPHNIDNLKQLTKLSHEVSGKGSFAKRALGGALLAFAAVFIMAKILVTAVKIYGGKTTTQGSGLAFALKAALASVTLNSIPGGLLYLSGKDKGLFKSISEFKDGVQTVREQTEPRQLPDDQSLNPIK